MCQCHTHPIQNFTSYQCLSPSFRSFVLQMSTRHIPSQVLDTLKDLRRTAAMMEEMNTLDKNEFGTLSIF